MITVYTCATNGRDSLRDDQCTEGAHFIAYVDQPDNAGKVWDCRRASEHFREPRRNARMHKILSHQFTESHYSIWMDANVALRVPAQLLIDDYLRGSDLAVFLHRTRVCTYDEAQQCRQFGLDLSHLIDEQVARYQRAGLRRAWGLAETTVVIRKHTDQVCQFNDAWWAEVCRYSLRDQIAFMYAVQQTGLKMNFIYPSKYRNPYFSVTNRPAGLAGNSKGLSDTQLN